MYPCYTGVLKRESELPPRFVVQVSQLESGRTQENDEGAAAVAANVFAV